MTYVDPLTVGCPVCSAPPAAPCVYVTGEFTGQPLDEDLPHPFRHEAASQPDLPPGWPELVTWLSGLEVPG